MDAQIKMMLGFFGFIAVLLIVYAIAHRRRELSGPATIVSRRLELGIGGGMYGDNWNRMITFRLSDGSELELFVTKGEFDGLPDGATGLLTWDKDILIHFDPDQGETK